MERVFALFRDHERLTSQQAGDLLGLEPAQAGNALGNLGIHALVQKRVENGRNVYSLTSKGRARLIAGTASAHTE